MTPTQSGLLRAICETPGDDLARLVYADWLEEQGRERCARFIRTQINEPDNLAAVESLWGSWPDTDDMRSFVFESLPETWTAWPLPFEQAYNRNMDGQAYVDRGFIAEIRCPLAVFLEHAATLFASHPIERVVITDRGPRKVTNSGGWEFWDESCGMTPAGTDDLPPEIMVHLEYAPGADPVPTMGVISFETAELGLAGLSFACVAYGRTLAGLPMLTPTHAQEG